MTREEKARYLVGIVADQLLEHVTKFWPEPEMSISAIRDYAALAHDLLDPAVSDDTIAELEAKYRVNYGENV